MIQSDHSALVSRKFVKKLVKGLRLMGLLG